MLVELTMSIPAFSGPLVKTANIKQELIDEIYYSDKYNDDEYEYRHVMLPKELAEFAPKNRLMAEVEWRSLGVRQSPGWVHYILHGPEKHILLFRRPLPKPMKDSPPQKRSKQTEP